MKILVVEDELVVADNLCNALTKVGYQSMMPAINYSQAVKKIELYHPDFAILDINLSGHKDGIDLASYIRENHNIPFVFLTAFGDDDTLNRAMKTKPCAYLIKPISKSELKPTIEIALINFKMRMMAERPHFTEILTPSEKRIVGMIANNKTSSQIANELSLSISTIKNHRHRICSKLELPPTNNALLTWAIQHGQNL
jgi:DNA-binding NarL/FixJ family response regulator